MHFLYKWLIFSMSNFTTFFGLVFYDCIFAKKALFCQFGFSSINHQSAMHDEGLEE